MGYIVKYDSTIFSNPANKYCIVSVKTADTSVNAVLHGGHWCPECLRKSWAYPKIARKNPFYAQVWDTQHKPEENYEIPMQYSAYEITKELKEKLGL